MQTLNAEQKRKQLEAIRLGIEWAYGTEKCYQCGNPCTGDYTLPICEDPEPTAGVTAPFCESCFEKCLMEEAN